MDEARLQFEVSLCSVINRLTLTMSNHVTSSISQYHSIPIPSLNTLGSFFFDLCFRQTNKQTDNHNAGFMNESVAGLLLPLVSNVVLPLPKFYLTGNRPIEIGVSVMYGPLTFGTHWHPGRWKMHIF